MIWLLVQAAVASDAGPSEPQVSVTGFTTFKLLPGSQCRDGEDFEAQPGSGCAQHSQPEGPTESKERPDQAGKVIFKSDMRGAKAKP
jgi:hypothetical protein